MIGSASRRARRIVLALGAGALAAAFIVVMLPDTPVAVAPPLEGPAPAAEPRPHAARGARESRLTSPETPQPPTHAVAGAALRPRGPTELDIGHEGDGARTLRGIVLDARGAPAEGARVVLRRLAWEVASMGGDVREAWQVVADADGAFTFLRAPEMQLALEARGLDGDMASMFVDAGWNVSLDVTLVLEATASITVEASQLVGRGVRLQPADPRARGWAVPAELPPEDAEALGEGDVGDGAVDDSAPHIDDGPSDVDAGMPSHDAMMMSVLSAVEAPLLDWDPELPEASLVRIAEGALTAIPAPLLGQFDAELRRGLELPPGTPRRALLEAAIAKVLEEEPALPRYVGLVAERFRAAPDRGLKALFDDPEFEREMREIIEADEAAEREAAAAEFPAHDSITAEAAEMAPPADLEPTPIDAERSRLAEAFPDLAHLLVERTWGAHEEAVGDVGEALKVRAGYAYDVIVEIGGEFWELNCGRVFVGAGDAVTVGCGGGEVTVTGRLVDGDGRPAPGDAFVQAMADGMRDVQIPACQADVGRDGSFRCTFSVDNTTTARFQLRRDLPGAVASVSRLRVTLVPGATVDLGTLVLRGFEGEDPVQFDGVELSDREEGLVFDGIDADAPVAALGIEPGDAIVRIGTLEAGRVPVADLFEGLAGGPENFGVDTDDDVLIRDSRGATFTLPFGALIGAMGGL